MSSREDFNWSDEAKNLREGKSPNFIRDKHNSNVQLQLDKELWFDKKQEIERTISGLEEELEKERLLHFYTKGAYERLSNLKLPIENIGKNISIAMMREKASQDEWVRLRDLFWKISSVPPEQSGLTNLNCFIEGYMAAKEEEKQKREDRIRDVVDSMPDANDEDDG